MNKLNQLAGFGLIVSALMPVSVSALDFGVDAHAGTMGLGVGAALQLTRNVNLRVGLNDWDDNFDIDDQDGLDYDGEYSLDNQYVMLDLYPSRNGSFHFSVGAYLNDNEITGIATVLSDGTSEIGDSDVLAGTVATGKIGFQSEAGYVGIGWGNTFSKGLIHFSFDLGAVLQGSPNADLNVTQTPELAARCALDPSLVGCVISEADILLEEQQLEDELSDYEVHPLVQLSVGFSF